MRDHHLVAKEIVSSEKWIAVFVGGVDVAVEQDQTDKEIAAGADHGGQMRSSHHFIPGAGAAAKKPV